MTDRSVKIGHTVLRSPILGASGCSGWGEEISGYNDMSAIGGFVTKSLTLNEKKGNEGSRLCETPSGLLNSIGLENGGLEFFIDNHLNAIRAMDCPVFINIAFFCRDELFQLIEKLEAHDGFDGYEINISCPNVHKGGMNINSSIDESRHAIEGLRNITEKTLILKLSPAFTESFEIAGIAQDEGFDAITFTNTYFGTAVDIRKREFVFKNKVAGLSGPAVKPMSLWNVYRMSNTVNIPIIGAGGVNSINDVLEFIIAGASAVQVGTALLVKPDILTTLTMQLDAYLEENGVSSLKDITGSIKEKE